MSLKLDKTSLTFYKIMHAIWELLDYYSSLLDIYVDDNPLELAQNCTIRTVNGMCFITCKIPRLSDAEPLHNVNEIHQILNEYLQVYLLPEFSELEPYRYGVNKRNSVNALCLDSMAIKENYMLFDFLFIDNPVALEQAKLYI